MALNTEELINIQMYVNESSNEWSNHMNFSNLSNLYRAHLYNTREKRIENLILSEFDRNLINYINAKYWNFSQ